MKDKKQTSQDQRRYLMSRLETANRNHRNSIDSCKLIEPPEVKIAREKVRKLSQQIERFDNVRYKYRNRLKNLVSNKKDSVRQIILFGDALQALKAVEEFEQTKFKTGLEE